jgi:hypothetical protein
MISKISKEGQIISIFNFASEITLLVQIPCLYFKKQERSPNDINNIGQMISIISKIVQPISKFKLASEITQIVQI